MIRFSEDDNLHMQQQWVAELGIDCGVRVFVIGDTYEGAEELKSNGNLEKEIMRAYGLPALVVGQVRNTLVFDT